MRTFIVLSLGLLPLGNFAGSKSGGKYLFSTLRSPILSGLLRVAQTEQATGVATSNLGPRHKRRSQTAVQSARLPCLRTSRADRPDRCWLASPMWGQSVRAWQDLLKEEDECGCDAVQVGKYSFRCLQLQPKRITSWRGPGSAAYCYSMNLQAVLQIHASHRPLCQSAFPSLLQWSQRCRQASSVVSQQRRRAPLVRSKNCICASVSAPLYATVRAVAAGARCIAMLCRSVGMSCACWK